METLDLTKILKDVPEGTKLYSTIHGVVTFKGVFIENAYPIEVTSVDNGIQDFTSEGLYIFEFEGECVLFPSKDNRDWSTFKISKKKFDISTLKPFDKVLVRDNEESKWQVGFYSYYNDEKIAEYRFAVSGNVFRCCIPYNDDTKNLVGTKNEAPEFYITWK